MPPEITDPQRLDACSRPSGAPVMHQRWSDLLFLHWQLDPDRVQSTLPEGLTVDTDAEGRAWIGLVPFAMSQIRPRGLFAVPWLSAFLEMNVRTYVRDENGDPGVYFYSLDAERWLAVKFARAAFLLPYFHASMKQEIDAETGWVDYTCRRSGAPSDNGDNGHILWLNDRFRADHPSPSDFRYLPSRDTVTTAPLGSLEFFLLERYTLFTERRDGQIASGRVFHLPYRYTDAVELTCFSPTALHQAGFTEIERAPDHVAWAAPVEVEVFPLRSVTNS